MGGILAAIEAGHPRREIERATYDYQKAVEAYATLGEVADAMRRVFGEYSEAI